LVGVIRVYNGLPAQEMERRITTISERALTTSVNSIEHIESIVQNPTDDLRQGMIVSLQGSS